MTNTTHLFKPHLDIPEIQRQLAEKVAEYEHRLLLNLLARELYNLTLRELAEFLSGPLGDTLASLPVTTLLNLAAQRAEEAQLRERQQEVEAHSGNAAAPSSTPNDEPSPPPAPTPPDGPASAPAHTNAQPEPPNDATTGRASGPTSAESRSRSPTELADAVLELLAAGPQSAADLRLTLRCSEVDLGETLRALRAQGAIEKSGVARRTRYSLPSQRSPVPAPQEQRELISEFDAAVLEAVRLAGDWITFTDLHKSLRCSEDALRATLHRLAGEGKIRRSGFQGARINVIA